MKIIFLLLIRCYWFFKSKKKTPSCIFKKSCSHYVYEKTKEEGFISGIKALKFRISNCKYGFELYENPMDKKTYMILPNKEIVEEGEIAKRLLK